jgi:hypothetical protein
MAKVALKLAGFDQMRHLKAICPDGSADRPMQSVPHNADE